MAMEAEVARLSRVRPFDLMPYEAVKLVVFAAEVEKIYPGQKLFSEGDAADSGYFVFTGVLTLRTQAGAELRVEEGSLLGEMALLTETLRPATATAEQEVRVLKIRRAVFRRALREYPRGALAVKTALSQRLRRMIRDLDTVRVRELDR